ncbi:hypothetical protein [Tropicimonas isoalkanivorans]|nr:hypothetical protein [Tropicimonas isoalkanivorans]
MDTLSFEKRSGLRAQIVSALEAAGFPNAKKLSAPDLAEVLGSVIRLRVDIKPARYPFGAGTSFLMVKLREKGMPAYKSFQKALQDVPGVIEWDHIPGRNADYLIRVVGKVGDPQMHHISACIGKMSNVQDVYAPPELTVAKSGVVDNFVPEDFLKFDLSNHPNPPRLHPWLDKADLDEAQLSLFSK